MLKLQRNSMYLRNSFVGSSSFTCLLIGIVSILGCCYSTLLKDSHNCVERAMHHNCPVCFEVNVHTEREMLKIIMMQTLIYLHLICWLIWFSLRSFSLRPQKTLLSCLVGTPFIWNVLKRCSSIFSKFLVIIGCCSFLC